MNWFKKLVPSRITTKKKQRVKSVPEGVWVTCDSCGAQLYRAELERNLNVCIKCDHHMRIPARERLESFFDASSSTEYFANLTANDPCLLYTSPSPRDRTRSRMPSSA